MAQSGSKLSNPSVKRHQNRHKFASWPAAMLQQRTHNALFSCKGSVGCTAANLPEVKVGPGNTGWALAAVPFLCSFLHSAGISNAPFQIPCLACCASASSETYALEYCLQNSSKGILEWHLLESLYRLYGRSSCRQDC